MRYIEDAVWAEKWDERIITVQQILHDENKDELCELFRGMHKMGNKQGHLRQSIVQAMRKFVKGDNRLTYILGGRSPLPYEVREVIWSVCAQVEQDTLERLSATDSLMDLVSTTSRNTWVYSKSNGDYKIKQFYPMDRYYVAMKAAKKMRRTLTEWFKMEIWDGTKGQLENGPQFFVDRLNEVYNQEV